MPMAMPTTREFHGRCLQRTSPETAFAVEGEKLDSTAPQGDNGSGGWPPLA